MGAKDHRESAEKESTARCAILTVTDSKTIETDTSGKAAFEIFRKFGHSVVLHKIIPNNGKKIASAAEAALKEAAVLLPLLLVLSYVAGRSLQYGSAEKDAGAYVPSTANVVFRARDLEKHAARIQDSAGWRVVQRRILKDPIVRREVNELLQAEGA